MARRPGIDRAAAPALQVLRHVRRDVEGKDRKAAGREKHGQFGSFSTLARAVRPFTRLVRIFLHWENLLKGSVRRDRPDVRDKAFLPKPKNPVRLFAPGTGVGFHFRRQGGNAGPI